VKYRVLTAATATVVTSKAIKSEHRTVLMMVVGELKNMLKTR